MTRPETLRMAVLGSIPKFAAKEFMSEGGI